ncbi:hypothetical protein [Oligoflexus tunisiensis]|uniref:hypothetical protein n=1 Tax=Oligoflexus tunisiensis TaxID=708132 RepID=UPI001C40208D|nr:hypothetical protein [Oligoflexus tunisiensis]
MQMRIPYGQSVYSFPLTTPRRITPFRITFVPTRACTRFSVYPRVRYQGSNTLSEVRFQNNLFVTDNKKVELIEINFVQNTYRWQDCSISIQSMATVAPVPPQRVFAGVVDHAGGFVNRKPVALQGSYYTQDIELVIPDYCSEYEVADLGVVTSDGTTFVAPESTRSRTISYHLPQPMTVASLEVSLLAPRAQSCQIPVYVRPLTSPR